MGSSNRIGKPGSRLAVLFEGSLAVLALVLGVLFGVSPAARLRLIDPAQAGRLLLVGVLAVLPMLSAFVLVPRLPWADLQRGLEEVERVVRQLFAGARLWELAAVSLAAGLGEELLFRGLLQDGLAGWLGAPYGQPLGLFVASLLFGLAHPLSAGYVVLAGLNGAYLGGLMIATGSLWPPVVAHAVYDLLALRHVLTRPPSSPQAEAGVGAVSDLRVTSEDDS
jgi:membrane protease YdiL (CAAX protease family)